VEGYCAGLLVERVLLGRLAVLLALGLGYHIDESQRRVTDLFKLETGIYRFLFEESE